MEMQRRRRRLLAARVASVGGVGVAAIAVVISVLAQSASGWDLSQRHTGGGGGRSSLGATAVQGSIGQALVGRSAQGNYAVAAGIFEAGPTKYIRRAVYVTTDGIP
jgi:hypothetical protein